MCVRRFGATPEADSAPKRYLPARRCQRVAFSIFLCFFLRMRLRRFLISDPMTECEPRRIRVERSNAVCNDVAAGPRPAPSAVVQWQDNGL